MLEVAGQFLTTYLFPEEQRRSAHFDVWADGQKVDAFWANKADFTLFECGGPVTLLVALKGNFGPPVLRPLSRGVKVQAEGSKVTFTIPGPGHYCLDFEGRVPLFIYANAPELAPPRPDDDKVHYFAAGKIHDVGTLQLHEGETLYIEGGAVVRGAIRCSSADNVTICGRGILDGSCFDFEADERVRHIVFEHCHQVLVEGITQINSTAWMLVLGHCRDVTVRNLKQIGSYVSTDGIDICGSKDVLIEDCCFRNEDDNLVVKAIAVKGHLPWDGNVENVRVRRCVILNGHPGNAMEIGYELRAEYIRDIVFEDIDVIAAHGDGAVFSIHNGDRSVVENVLWENIRVEHYWDKLIDLRVVHSRYNLDKTRGTVRNIRFKNIRVLQSIFNPGCSISLVGGFEAGNPITGIVLEDFFLNDHKVTHADDLEIHTRYADEITVI